MIWFKFNGLWMCFYQPKTSRRYSRPADWLREAEHMMSVNARDDVLWRKREASARRMVWC